MALFEPLFAEPVLDFEELWSRAERIPLRRTEARVASIPHVIELKRRAGRPKDLEDIALTASFAATPAQRLEWLEEALELAWAAGALPGTSTTNQVELRDLEAPAQRE